MTTIAFDGRYLAADGRMTRGGIITSNSVKKIQEVTAIIRGVKQEVIIFGAGSWGGIYSITQWMKENDVFDIDPQLTRPFFPVDHEGHCQTQDVAFITKEGQLYALDDQCRPAPYDAPFAEGSGFPFAQMALTLGMSAVEAVRASIKMDTGSGGTITCFDVEEWKWVDPSEF